MRTHFTDEQRADPATAESEKILRACVHCGFCTATCPTYVLLGDELDSPRGRIYLIKDMLENERKPSEKVVTHLDRCLSCLACMTTCPSGVNYMHLIDHARAYVHEHYQRSFADRLLRAVLAWTLPHPARLRLALALARIAKPFAGLFARIAPPLAAMLRLAPGKTRAVVSPTGSRAVATRGRVILLQGCVEPVLKPEIKAASVRLLNRMGYDIVAAPGEVCCGALVHHMGREDDALVAARRNVDAWEAAVAAGKVDAIVVSAAGCGTSIKNYGFLLRTDAAYAAKAARISAMTRDISEFLDGAGPLPPVQARNLTVAYHAACSLQHGQGIVSAPQRLLAAAGFNVREPAEAHLCCGSAGTYNILQPKIATQLGQRKARTLMDLKPDVVATGNIGCAAQLQNHLDAPVAHVVELLDWATGGPPPSGVGIS